MMMGMGGVPPIMHKSMGNTMMPGAMMPQPGQVLVLAPGTASDFMLAMLHLQLNYNFIGVYDIVLVTSLENL